MRLFFALLVSVFLFAPGTAKADLQEGESTVFWQVSGGADFHFITDEDIGSVYAQQSNGRPRPLLGVRGRTGLVLGKRAIPGLYLEANIGFGFTNKKGAEVGEDSRDESGETSKLSYFPLDAELLIGFDAFPEQVLVPFAAIGLDMVPFTETSSIDDATKGLKFGWHFRAGLAILLDLLEPLRASTADARSGLNDIYLTTEAIHLKVPAFGKSKDEGFKFDGWSFRVGLKFVL